MSHSRLALRSPYCRAVPKFLAELEGILKTPDFDPSREYLRGRVNWLSLMSCRIPWKNGTEYRGPISPVGDNTR